MSVEIRIDQYADFLHVFEVTDERGSPIDVESFQVEAYVAKFYTSNSVALTASLFVSPDDEKSYCSLSLTAAQTGALEPDQRYVYSAYLKQSNTTSPLQNGVATVIAGVKPSE